MVTAGLSVLPSPPPDGVGEGNFQPSRSYAPPLFTFLTSGKFSDYFRHFYLMFLCFQNILPQTDQGERWSKWKLGWSRFDLPTLSRFLRQEIILYWYYSLTTMPILVAFLLLLVTQIIGQIVPAVVAQQQQQLRSKSDAAALRRQAIQGQQRRKVTGRFTQ